MFEEVSSINHEWRNSSTSKPSKLVTVTGCRESMGKWHHDMPQHSAEPIPHTRPWHPRHQSGCFANRCPWRTRLSSAPRPGPGNRDRSRLASSSRALPFKSWSLKSGEHMTFNSDMWISLIQNLANNAESDSCLQHLHIWQLSLRWKMNDETTGPPNHPNLSLSKDVENIWKQKHSAVGSNVKTWSLKSWEHMTCNSDMWISLMQYLANNAEINSCWQHLHIWQLSLRWKMNDETAAPPNHPNLSLSKDVENMRSWHAAAFSDSAEPIPHTRPWRPRHQSCWNSNGCLWRTSLSSAPRPRPGNRDRSRLASSSRALPFKSWSLKSGEHMTFNSDLWISLKQNLANNAEINSCWQHLHIWQLSLRWRMNDETAAPPNHPNLSLSQDAGKVWESNIMTCRSIQRSPSHTPGLGPLGTNLAVSQIDVRDGRVCLQRLGQGLETETDQASSSRALPFKSWSLKSGEHMTFNSDLWISLIQNLANNAEINSCWQHLHIWQLSLRWRMNDETPAPPNHPNLSLSQDAGEVQEGDIMTCRSIQRSPSHTPGLGPLGTNLAASQIDVRDGRVCLQRLGQGLETETDQDWRLHPGFYRSNRDHWNPENTWHIITFIWDILPGTKFERTIQQSTISFRIYHVDRFHSNIRFIITKLNVGTWILGSSMRKVLAIEPS